jgi:hypothetical protein
LEHKIKNRQMELHQNKKLLHDKQKTLRWGTTYLLEENIFEIYIS